MELCSPQKNLVKLSYSFDQTPLGETGCLSKLYYLLLKHPKYIFKIAPSKNTFSKIIFFKNINFIFSIYCSSESLDELSKSSIICLVFPQYIYILFTNLWIIVFTFFDSRILANYCYTSMIRVYL